MLAEFVEFVDNIIPIVSEEQRNKTKDAILQFEKYGEQLKYMMLEPLDVLSQGDIISKVPFSYFDDNGEQCFFVSDAMVISTSCNIDNKNRILLTPVFPISVFEGNALDLKKNVIFDYMYIPDDIMKNKYVDFECMGTYSKDLIIRGIADKRIKRIGSLNQLGYYFMIVKLSVFLMRREDEETMRKRGTNFLHY